MRTWCLRRSAAQHAPVLAAKQAAIRSNKKYCNCYSKQVVFLRTTVLTIKSESLAMHSILPQHAACACSAPMYAFTAILLLLAAIIVGKILPPTQPPLAKNNLVLLEVSKQQKQNDSSLQVIGCSSSHTNTKQNKFKISSANIFRSRSRRWYYYFN